MTPKTQALVEAVLALPPENRTALIEKVLESLETQEQAEIDRAWAVEAERRLKALDEGTARKIPAEEVFKTLSHRKR
jgi:putative addiction module component (TIGR02574 family)